MLNLIFFAIAIYLGWDYYSFTTDPTSDYGMKKASLDEKKTDITTKEKKIAEAKTFYQNLEKKREELRRLSTELTDMKSKLTENNDIPAFMKLVLNEAKRVGLMVTSLSPLPSQKMQYYIEQPFDLNFQGVYVQLIAFLDRLAQAERIVRIDDFTVRPRSTAAKNSKFVDLEGTIKVRTYVYLGTQEDDVATSGGSDAIKNPTVKPPEGGT
ncbi:MAG: type 4a pilus biogenesis protein PilO [Bdellovibrionales bacterium]|nr:type 4a pilus biogenesis protein PilO [Bdellovibrionales bacterium]